MERNSTALDISVNGRLCRLVRMVTTEFVEIEPSVGSRNLLQGILELLFYAGDFFQDLRYSGWELIE
jgi:hypothetical protein